MKKILAVLIAISMVATMAFAADFTFEVKTAGDIANWKTGDKAATLLTRDADALKVELKADAEGKAGAEVTLKNETVTSFDMAAYDAAVEALEKDKEYAKLVAAVAAAEDSAALAKASAAAEAYAEKKLATKNFTATKSYIVASNASVWIIPVDGLKLTFGAASLNAGAVADFDGDTKADAIGAVKADGFTAEYTAIENLELSLGLKKGIKTNKLDDADLVAVKAAYTVCPEAKVVVTADNKMNAGVVVSGEYAPVAYVAGVNYAAKKTNVAEKVTLTVAPVTVWEAVNYDVDGKAVTALEGLTVAVAPVTFTQNAKYAGKVISGDVKAEVAVPVAEITTVKPYVSAKTADVKAIAKNVEVKAGASAEFTGTIDAATWKVAPACDVTLLQKTNVAVTVPFSVTVKY